MRSAASAERPGAAQARRLREVWRSAGWPCHDTLEAELLAAGWLERLADGGGRERLRVSDAGVAAIAAAAAGNRRARALHEALVDRVALEMQRAGRVVWRGLSLRAPPLDDAAVDADADADADANAHARAPAGSGRLDEAAASATAAGPGLRRVWAVAMPDVYSIRHTSREDAVEPIVHEIKVHRADLLSDLRHAAKREAYRRIAGQCWYVLRAGIGRAEEIPPEYGVMLAEPAPCGTAFGRLEVVRPAPRRACRLPFMVWMALARAAADPPPDEPAQARF